MEIIPTLHRYSFKWTFWMPEVDVDDGVGLRPKGDDFPPEGYFSTFASVP